VGLRVMFSNTLHTINPSFLPGFTFAWVQLISHRFFMPKLLEVEGQNVCVFYSYTIGLAILSETDH
jgi:hypothetical protein